MNEIRTVQIMNGDHPVDYRIYRCEGCGEEVEEAWPFYESDEGVFCMDCAFVNGLISESEYVKSLPVCLDGVRAAVKDGKIYIETNGRQFAWEKTKTQQRKTAEYVKWRNDVFKRDGYKCAICGKVGGELNAHHIKPFAKYKEDRFDVDNGITLCKECHKTVHMDKDSRWIKE